MRIVLWMDQCKKVQCVLADTRHYTKQKVRSNRHLTFAILELRGSFDAGIKEIDTTNNMALIRYILAHVVSSYSLTA